MKSRASVHPSPSGALFMLAASAALIAGAPVRSTAQTLTSISGYKVESRSANVTEPKAGSLAVCFEPGQLPTVRLLPSRPWNWQQVGALAVDVSNTEGHEIHFGLQIDALPDTGGVKHSQSATVVIPARSTVTCIFSRPTARHKPSKSAAVASKTRVRLVTLKGDPRMDFRHVFDVSFFLQHPTQPTTVQIGHPRLLPVARASTGSSLSQKLDAYGQRGGATWPAKVQSTEQLRARRDAEQSQFRGRSSELDSFGGWMGGPNLEAATYFRTKKVHGKWWFVTPDGHLFFSWGLDGVNAPQPTVVASRSWMFSWLPDRKSPLADCYGQTPSHQVTFDFYQANLERKLGSNWQQGRVNQALSRLVSWGFNTLGHASAENLYGNGRLPYAVTARYPEHHARIQSTPDPFDPAFERDLEQGLKQQSTGVSKDPYCLGWFVDDRLDWGEDDSVSLVKAAFRLDSRYSPAKRALIARLKKSYSSIAALNAAWQTHLGSWEELDHPFAIGATGSTQRADLSALLSALARQYFSVVHQAVHRADPNHLYLGCRFASAPPAAVSAAAEFCDVVSFSAAAPNLKSERWAALKNIGKPCLLGEVNPGAMDRGLLSAGPVSTVSQSARAAFLKDYASSVVECPTMIGCHLFEYSDEPVLGRASDGGRANVGFVDVTDTPYVDMVEAARATAAEMYPRRYALIAE